jgi:hypothetical protein
MREICLLAHLRREQMGKDGQNRAYVPVKTGLRFSMNAVRPSVKSRLA